MTDAAKGEGDTFGELLERAASVMVSLMLDFHWLFYCLIVTAVAGLLFARGLAEMRGIAAKRNG